MLNKNKQVYSAINSITDVIITFAAYFLSMFIRYSVLKGTDAVNATQGIYVLIALFYSIAIVFVYFLLGFYESIRINKLGNDSFYLLITNAVGVLIWMVLLFLNKQMNFSRISLVLFWFMSTILLISKRAIFNKIYSKQKSLPKNQKHVLIMGNGKLAKQFIEDVNNKPELGLTIDGYVSKAVKPELGKNFGSYEELPEILENNNIDILVVALENHESQFLSLAFNAADKEGIRIELIPFYNEYIPSKPLIENIGKSKLIDLRATALDNLGWATIKRFIDIIGSIALIIVTSPLMIITAIGVKLSSPGPILFKQDRIGKDKKPFKMYKFRSMKVNSEENTAWSTNEDPRKTKFGTFIRKYSLDELPQFFNVLLGQMSLVGPRPEIPFHVNHFKNEIPRYLVRLQVRPGITGWAQINGWRGDTSIDSRIDFDIWYIENWSLGLDIQILWNTVFKGKFKNEEQ